MRQPFEFYVDSYNMVGKSRYKADYRFSKSMWGSLMKYRQWEIEDAVKAALKRPQLELLREWRFKDIVCEDCKTRGWLGGAAITSWTCPVCRVGQTSGSTATPAICSPCAIRLFQCQRCRKSLDEDLERAS